jgi:hypothetical protein
MDALARLATAHADFKNFVAGHWGNEANCSGLPTCEYCLKRMYKLRTTYLKAYIALFNENPAACPLLEWTVALNANRWRLGDVHSSKCNTGQQLDNCSCIMATFTKVAYSPPEQSYDELVVPSFGDQIYPVLMRMVQRHKIT